MKRGTHTVASGNIVAVEIATVSVQIVRIVVIVVIAGTQHPDTSFRPKRKAYIAYFSRYLVVCKFE